MCALVTGVQTCARPISEGIAISFVAPDEKTYLRDIERVTRTRAEPVKLPEAFSDMVRNLPKPIQPPRDTGGKGRDPQRQREDAHRGKGDGQPIGQAACRERECQYV